MLAGVRYTYNFLAFEAFVVRSHLPHGVFDTSSSAQNNVHYRVHRLGRGRGLRMYQARVFDNLQDAPAGRQRRASRVPRQLVKERLHLMRLHHENDLVNLPLAAGERVLILEPRKALQDVVLPSGSRLLAVRRGRLADDFVDVDC